MGDGFGASGCRLWRELQDVTWKNHLMNESTKTEKRELLKDVETTWRDHNG